MKIKVPDNRIKVYGWIALVYLGLWLFGDLMRHPETFPKRAWNNIWLISYLAVLNFIFFRVHATVYKIFLHADPGRRGAAVASPDVVLLWVLRLEATRHQPASLFPPGFSYLHHAGR